MLNVDMGLYVDFDIESGDPTHGGKGHGRPKGCQGLNRSSWINHLRKRRGTVYANGILPEFTEDGYLEYSDIKTLRYALIIHCLLDIMAVKRKERLRSRFFCKYNKF